LDSRKLVKRKKEREQVRKHTSNSVRSVILEGLYIYPKELPIVGYP